LYVAQERNNEKKYSIILQKKDLIIIKTTIKKLKKEMKNKMPYCCSCGKKIEIKPEFETGAADAKEAYICSKCEWEDYVETSDSKHTFCSLCGIKLKNIEIFKTHDCEEMY